MVVDSGPQCPFSLACRHAFWDITRVEIIKFAKVKGIYIPGSASLFQTLFTAIKGILKVSDAAALDYVSTRLVNERNSQQFAEYLTHMDAAIELVGVQDRQQVLNEQKGALYKLYCLDEMKFEYATMRQETDKRRKKQPSTKATLPRDVISQQDAASYLPENASIWLSNTRNEWWGHYPPYKRMVKTWDMGDAGEAEACSAVIMTLWCQHCERKGISKDEIPFQGISL